MQPLLGYEGRFLVGLFVTAAVAVAALALALTLGLAGAAAKLSRSAVARRVAGFYTTVVRGIPELLFILIIYYDLQGLVNVVMEGAGRETWIIPPFWAGAVAIGIFYGAYMTETFRGAMLAVPAGQGEAGMALGLPRRTVFWRVTAPQMLRHALPGIRNNWLVLLKATALVSVIGLSDDMMAVANQAKSKTHLPFLFYCAAALGYLFLTALSGAAFNWIERRARRGVDLKDAEKRA